MIDHILSVCSSYSVWAFLFVFLYLFYRLLDFLLWAPQRFLSYWKAQGLKAAPYKLFTGSFTDAHEAAKRFEHIEHSLETVRKYGLVVPTVMGPLCFLTINDPNIIKLIFTKSAGNYIKSDESSKEMLRIYLLNGLLLSEGPEWKKNRKLLTPAFHFMALKEYLPIIKETVKKTVNSWVKAIETKEIPSEWSQRAVRNNEKFIEIGGKKIPQGNSSEIRFLPEESALEMDICHECAGITLNSILTTLFGREFSNSQKKIEFLLLSHYILELQTERTLNLIGYTPIIKHFPVKSLNHLKWASKRIHEMIKEIIETRKREKKENSSSTEGRMDLLDRMLEMNQDHRGDGEYLTDQSILEESVNFISAGAETTSNLLSWLLYRAASEPEVWTKMQQEVDYILQGEAADAESIKELKYLEAVIYESLRLHAPATNIIKMAAKTHQLGDLTIPKDTVVFIQAHVIHRIAEYWPNPEKFQPERFLNSEFDWNADEEGNNEKSSASAASSSASSSSSSSSAKQHPFAFVGFSAGPRKCIGKNFALMELKLILIEFLQSIEISLIPGQRIVPDPTSFQPKFGILMKIFPRKTPRWDLQNPGMGKSMQQRKVFKPVGMI